MKVTERPPDVTIDRFDSAIDIFEQIKERFPDYEHIDLSTDNPDQMVIVKVWLPQS